MIRITGGDFRGRVIKAPQGERTRPTQSRLRQALFNSLQTVIADSRVLDLFSGSGSLGFESLSRGAIHAVFVEDARPAVKLIESNGLELKVRDRMSILASSISETLVHSLVKLGPFDIILADPPYVGGWETKLFAMLPWEKLLNEGGYYCLEWGAQKSEAKELPQTIGPLVKIREKNYGDSILTTYRRDIARDE